MDRFSLAMSFPLPCLAVVLLQSGTAFAAERAAPGDGQGRWSLTSGVSIMPRQQLPFCATSVKRATRDISVAGGGQPAFYLDGQKSSMLTYTFQGAALVLYGGAMSANGTFNSPTIVVDGRVPALAVNPEFKDGLACDVALAVFNDLSPDDHSMNLIGTPGQQIVLYNVTVFASPLVLTRTASASSASTQDPSDTRDVPGTASVSDTIHSSTTTSVAGDSKSTPPGTTVGLDPASSTTTAPHDPRGETPILAIALSLTFGIAALAALVALYLYWRQRRSHLSPYNDQLRTPREESELCGPAKKSTFFGEDTATGTAGDETGDTVSIESEGAELAAIRQELRTAGLSTRALLHSLRRLHGHPRESGSQASTAAEPPGYTQ